MFDTFSTKPGQEPLEKLLQIGLNAPRRSSLGIIHEERVSHAILGETIRRRIFLLGRLFDPRLPLAIDASEVIDQTTSVEQVEHPLAFIQLEGSRPDPKHCLQRIRALWLIAENKSGQLTNDPVLPFRHQAALLQYLTGASAPRRALIADEVGLGKTVEAGLMIRSMIRDAPQARILYITLASLVSNVLEEFERLDLGRWYYYANLDDRAKEALSAVPTTTLNEDTKRIVASVNKLCDTDRWQYQHEVLGSTRFDLIIVDECHTLRAYGSSADSPQVWFRSVRQLLTDHLAPDGRTLFLSATPHQGHREVFLNLVSLCLGTSLTAPDTEKAAAARGRVIFRIKEHIRDWDNKRVFPPREVKPPELAEPPLNYRTVLDRIAAHFDWVGSNLEGPQARAVGFVKSQALQFAASSLRAGFAYLLRRLIRCDATQASSPHVRQWAERLLPYRGEVRTARELLESWLREFKSKQTDELDFDGELTEYPGDRFAASEIPKLFALLSEFNSLFDDPEAGAKFICLANLVSSLEEPIVVFSQAVDTVYELEARLIAAGYKVYRITGDMSLDQRRASISGFRTSSTARRLLLSSAAGGVGINLQVARVVIHFDLPWNPMVLEQRVGRVHRIGSTRTILVETILLRGSREAEVFDRITRRLHDIVRDLSGDLVEREALFRRILASLDPEALREILSGEDSLDSIGAAVDAGRQAVTEADRYMQELAAHTVEKRGLATTNHLVSFLRQADSGFQKAGNAVYAMLTEAEGGELEQLPCNADQYRFDGEKEPLVFDRTAASYLGLRREQTGGLGQSSVDPLIRAAMDLTIEAKAKSSAWLSFVGVNPTGIEPGDIIYFAIEAAFNSDTLIDPDLRAWRIRNGVLSALEDSTIEIFLWSSDVVVRQKAGSFSIPRESVEDLVQLAKPLLHFPIAAIGIRERV